MSFWDGTSGTGLGLLCGAAFVVMDVGTKSAAPTVWTRASPCSRPA